MDREKVVKGLEYCKHTDGVECPNCPYWPEDDCVEILHADALNLLKEQEAITIKKTKEHGFGVYGGICPKCRNWIQSAHSYCGFCGQAVKWE